jgi:hypothetical protein
MIIIEELLCSRHTVITPERVLNISVSDRVKHDDHDTAQHIPIIVNGEVTDTKKSKVELFTTGGKGSTQNTTSELIKELTNKRNSYSVNKKIK